LCGDLYRTSQIQDRSYQNVVEDWKKIPMTVEPLEDAFEITDLQKLYETAFRVLLETKPAGNGA
jgi:hypothetical protein